MFIYLANEYIINKGETDFFPMGLIYQENEPKFTIGVEYRPEFCS